MKWPKAAIFLVVNYIVNVVDICCAIGGPEELCVRLNLNTSTNGILLAGLYIQII